MGVPERAIPELRDARKCAQPRSCPTGDQAPSLATMISTVAKVVVPVLDQDRAKRFWTESVGFEARRDETVGDERWIEVALAGGGPVLVLSPRSQDRSEVGADLPHSPVFFTCDDVEATYRELSEHGVTFALPPTRQHFGWWSLFEDPDGTRYALGQWT
jgi:predicted enzyme related to lactoylglutathione lyase